jgi:hypothetical protein
MEDKEFAKEEEKEKEDEARRRSSWDLREGMLGAIGMLIWLCLWFNVSFKVIGHSFSFGARKVILCHCQFHK